MDENKIIVPTWSWGSQMVTFEAYFMLSTSEQSMSTINELKTQDNGASDSTDDTTEFPDWEQSLRDGHSYVNPCQLYLQYTPFSQSRSIGNPATAIQKILTPVGLDAPFVTDKCTLQNYDYKQNVATELVNVYLKDDGAQTSVTGLITETINEEEFQLESLESAQPSIVGEYWADIRIGFEGEPTHLLTPIQNTIFIKLCESGFVVPLLTLDPVSYDIGSGPLVINLASNFKNGLCMYQTDEDAAAQWADVVTYQPESQTINYKTVVSQETDPTLTVDTSDQTKRGVKTYEFTYTDYKGDVYIIKKQITFVQTACIPTEFTGLQDLGVNPFTYVMLELPGTTVDLSSITYGECPFTFTLEPANQFVKLNQNNFNSGPVIYQQTSFGSIDIGPITTWNGDLYGSYFFTLTMSAKDGSFIESVPIQVEFAKCAGIWTTMPDPINIEYTLETIVQIQLAPFIVEGQECNPMVTTFASVEYGDDLSAMSSLTQQSEFLGTALLEIYTEDPQFIRNITIAVTSTDHYQSPPASRSQIINIKVVDPCQDATIQNVIIKDIEVMQGNVLQAGWTDFTAISDLEECRVIEYTVQFILPSKSNVTQGWFHVDYNTKMISFDQNYAQKSFTDSQEIQVIITGTINGREWLSSNSTVFKITILPVVNFPFMEPTVETEADKEQLAEQEVFQSGEKKQDSNEEEEITWVPQFEAPVVENPTPLFALISDISVDGILRIQFNKPLLIPQVYQNVAEKRLQADYNETIHLVLDLQMVSGIDIESSDRLEIVKFNLTDFQSTFMLIKIEFLNPSQISQSVMRDDLRVKFLLHYIFVDSQQFQTLEQDTVLKSEVPPQLTTEQLTVLEEVQATVDKVTQVIAVSNVVINVLLAASLRLLWNLVNLLQFLVYMQLWKIHMPTHAQTALKFLKNIALLEFIPTSHVTGYVSGLVGLDPDNPDGIFNQMGLMLVLAVGLLALVILLAVMPYFLSTNYKLYRAYRLLRQKVFYNLFLRYLLQSNLKLGVGASAAVLALTVSQSHEVLVSSVMGFVVLVFILFSPVGFYLILRKNKANLNRLSMKAKIGSLYVSIKTNANSAWPMLYTSIFMIRRIVFLLITFVLADWPALQIHFWTSITLYTIIYLMMTKPYETPFSNYVEFVNECIFLGICYCFELLTDLIDDPQTKWNAGWALNAHIGLMLTVNLSVMGFVNVSAYLRSCKLKRLKKLQLKKLEQHKKQRQLKKQLKIEQEKLKKKARQEKEARIRLEELIQEEILELELRERQMIEMQQQQESLQQETQQKQLVRVKQHPRRNGGLQTETKFSRNQIDNYRSYREQVLAEFDRNLNENLKNANFQR